ncbi:MULTISPECIES: precorrin-6y C5,15-methyltransferase (decarboxylating) subunit CbiE [Bacteroides]|uniref:precorrin-6y C5,15-methyltransferase (decarboxylating) subunit CbiE n=1 Tax=Bacteroides TaxID=816 RepID=UPI000E4349C9|nr:MULTISPECIES: precorrin-6y C5,15-methyltransferase (decarboxylating) subunit CbiE [Bacteroides]MBS7574360.1 precorrin-6y C5,15-methyltransferase (decarboxylating) subunit CbiE [Bacteroides propionicigenes]RGM26923.1 precorrin-6y C5,15-methyltransferase (decarboxylating) subunit CbiE [Bacteroides sp. OM08-17BH]RHJ50886.1 precorrin-6y C5,15-methyltransferase (decarboxylating) subunit CbiE [Bacteroides sp. AM10-21B]HBO06025.1 bifunctional cobalt-precorrin-7 (C(5))-methyltransferase/cobalt-preco
MERKFIIIGMDDNRVPFFSPEVLEHIRNGKVFSGGVRHRGIVKSLLPEDAEWISISVPLDNVFAQYERVFGSDEYRQTESDISQIIIFASGDPLFFGFANTVKRKLPDADIKLYPSFNSLQTLAHRLVMPYNDMRTVSLTGRPWHDFDRALIERAPKIGVLTDREHTPAAIAARMLEYGYQRYTMYVGEHLGNPEKERIRHMTLKEAVQDEFQYPNNLLLYATSFPESRPFGIPDEQFAHLDGRARMITKAPIRLLTLQALELNRHRVFWDIGFCTGSVSIEARLQFPHLTIVSFEIREEGKELMNINSRRFGTPGITAIIGDFLQTATDTLSRPDAVFIGGHGGHLPEMLMKIKETLQPNGCIVFNSVSAESKNAFIEGAKAAGFTLHPSTRIALNDYNPIEIMKATLS